PLRRVHVDDAVPRNPETGRAAAVDLDSVRVEPHHRGSTQSRSTGDDALLPTARHRRADVDASRFQLRFAGIVGHGRERRYPHALGAGLPSPAAPHAVHTEREERKDQQCQQKPVHHTSFPSREVMRPRSNVALTTAGSRRPSYGVFLARLANSEPWTVHSVSRSTSTRFAGSPSANGLPWSGSPAI